MERRYLLRLITSNDRFTEDEILQRIPAAIRPNGTIRDWNRPLLRRLSDLVNLFVDGAGLANMEIMIQEVYDDRVATGQDELLQLIEDDLTTAFERQQKAEEEMEEVEVMSREERGVSQEMDEEEQAKCEEDVPKKQVDKGKGRAIEPSESLLKDDEIQSDGTTQEQEQKETRDLSKSRIGSQHFDKTGKR